ncbi:MAG: DNA-protecting protein DprA [Gammaproteobacteria bacterium]|nr:DNA-protecting protein DprA [Gammaproteobacteria bacterium]
MIIDSFSPYEEMIAYETLWNRKGATIKKMAEYLSHTDRPSKAQFTLLEEEEKEEIDNYFSNIEKNFSIITSESYQYPLALKDPDHQIKLLYYKGDLGLLDAPKRISIVGARKASPEGLRRAAKLARLLVSKGYIIVSGLAEGIDTAAMTAAIAAGGKVIGVIGTPINEYYPKNNIDLQNEIAENHLLVSHVPIYRYAHEHFNTKRFYFPQRNVTMAAISDATIIVEASETSGTLTQARACVSMSRKLFILNSCFENSDISWPAKYEAKGAIRVKDIGDILKGLGE